MNLICVGLFNNSIRNQDSSLALVLDIDELTLYSVLGIVPNGLKNSECLFTMQQVHWVEAGDARDFEDTLGGLSTVAYNQAIRKVRSEMLIVFVSIFEMICV